MEPLAKGILEFWLGTEAGSWQDRLTHQRPTFVRSLDIRFGSYVEAARMGALDRWLLDPKATTALILLLDLIAPLVRKDPEPIYSKKALTTSVLAINQGSYLKVPPLEGVFQLNPCLQSQDPNIQEAGRTSFEALKFRYQDQHIALDQLKAALSDHHAKDHPNTTRL